MENLSPRSVIIFKTSNLYLSFFGLGLCTAIRGPCLLDLEKMVQTDSQHMAIIFTAKSIGFLIGSILGGIVLDALKPKQTVMIICNFLMASSMLAVPWCRNLDTLTGIMAVQGLAMGTIDTGGNAACLRLWGSESGPFYQALHFFYGLGGLVAPLIAAPFLGDYSGEIHVSQENATLIDNFINVTVKSIDYNNSALENTVPNISYPFLMFGGFGLLVTGMFIFVCIMYPEKEEDTRNADTLKLETNFAFLFSVVCLSSLLVFVEMGTEMGYSQMLTTYVVKSRLQLSSSTGSYMTSAFWAAFTISRLASIFLAIKISNFGMIVCDLVMIFAGSLVLLCLVSYEWAIWIASVLLGAGAAPFFPAAVAWISTYITVTNKIASTFTVGTALGEMVSTSVISYFIDSFPDVLLYVVLLSSVCSSLTAFILCMLFRKREKKITRQKYEYSLVNRPSTVS